MPPGYQESEKTLRAKTQATHAIVSRPRTESCRRGAPPSPFDRTRKVDILRTTRAIDAFEGRVNACH